MTRAVVAARVVLLALAASAVVAAVVVARGDRDEVHARYVCPMHAEVTSATPGTCPICGMDLEPVATGAPAAIEPSSYLSYDTERRRAYGPDAPAPAWVDDDGTISALLYVDEVARRPADERATFYPAATPAQGVAVTATPDAPSPWDRSTLRARYRPEAAGLPAGEVGWLRRPRSPESPVVPVAAVLEDATGPYVLVASADGRALTRRSLVVGRMFGGMAAVVSGLRASERVLIGSTFFVDAERRLRGDAAIDVAR